MWSHHAHPGHHQSIQASSRPSPPFPLAYLLTAIFRPQSHTSKTAHTSFLVVLLTSLT
ncbi:hypothetical protein I352_01182 [Cryptococcus deuterogattii MMRL2647]|nr:hypothetical protein I352_01182 [Cryptococcus deuterogattii MMRL2647]